MKHTSRWTSSVVALVIFLLTIDVVLLSRKNLELESRLHDLTTGSITPPLSADSEVKPFPVLTLERERQVLDVTEPGSTYLLYVFSTTCPHCEANLGKWRVVAESAGSGVYVVGVSLDSPDKTTGFVSDREVPFYTVCVADDVFESAYNIRAVPATILITGGGRVEESWAGELNVEQVGQIIGKLREINRRLVLREE